VSATTRNGSTAWEYTSPPLGPGQSTEPVPFPAAGTYVFLDRRGVGPLSTEQVGRIVVVAPAPPTQAPAPAPAPAPPPADAPSPPGGGQQAPPAPAPAPPAPAGGSADGPSLAGGIAPAPLDGGLEGTLVPPSIADGFGTQPPVAAPGEQVQALRGPLPGGANARGFGLVAVLAALGVVGMASLLVRVLLAEPAARRPLLAVRELSPAS
jgi:hypothetical protein